MKTFHWTALLLLLGTLCFLWLSPPSNRQLSPHGADSDPRASSASPPIAETRPAPTAPKPTGPNARPLTAAQPEVLPLPDDFPGPLQRHAAAHWPQADRLAHWRIESDAQPALREVMLLRDPGLPYRLRMEFIRLPDGRSTIREMVADHLLVRFSDSRAARTWARQSAPADLRLGRPIGGEGLFRVRISGDQPLALPEAIANLQADAAAVAYAEPDYIARLLNDPNDPRYRDGTLWGLDNQANPTADMAAPQGWAIRHDAPGVIVGIVDSGLRTDHEDLLDNLWTNPAESPDGIDNDGNGYIDDIHGINAIEQTGKPNDDTGHGTHVAGIIGATGNNGLGISGVAWDVQLMPLKFISASGGGSISDAILCLEYGMENGVDLFSNSWGSSSYSRAFHETADQAAEAGILLLAAAGNYSTNNDVSPVFPASLPGPNILTVAATNRYDELSTFSSFGQGFVDLAAPGTDILSTGNNAPDHYHVLSGTSMATPYVSGALALLRAHFPGDSATDLLQRLLLGADPVDALANGTVGQGLRLNLEGALRTAAARPRNDHFQNARPLYGDAVLLRTRNNNATGEPDEPAFAGESNPNSIWFSFTPMANGEATIRQRTEQSFQDPIRGTTTSIPNQAIPAALGVFTGDSLAELQPVATGLNALSFVVQAGQTYHLAAAGAGGAEGLMLLEIVGPPRNSELANAVELKLRRAITGTNRNALPEEGEPDHAGTPATASVWYQWTAHLSGKVGFTTRNSDFATRAAVYKADPAKPGFAGLIPLDSTVSSGTGAARVTFTAVTGETYYFAVDGIDGASGTVSALLALIPPNDNFADSSVWRGTDIRREVTTSFASREEGEPQHLPGQGTGETIWFSWTAPADTRISFSSSGSFLPAILAVYTGDAVDQLELVGRDGAPGRGATVIFDAAQGTTYRMVVEGWDRPLTNLPVHFQSIPAPPNDHFADATVLSGRTATATGSVSGASRETGEPDGHNNEGGSIWFRWTAPANEEIGLYAERLDKPRLWNPILNLHTGPELNQLDHVKVEFGNGIGRDGYLRWSATAGTTYHIQITSTDANQLTGGGGPFTLRLAPVASSAPAHDDFHEAIALDGTTVYNFRTANYAAGSEAGEPDHGGYTPTRTLWWKFTPAHKAAAGRYAVSTALSESALITAVYRAPGTGPHSFADLVPITDNSQAATYTFPDVAWNAAHGYTYYIATNWVAGPFGRLIFHFQKVPRNHVFAHAAEITGTSATRIAHNWGTIREPGEPDLGASSGNLGSRSLWWKWTAPANGRFQLDTIGSETPAAEDNVAYPGRTVLGFDTRLGVFTGGRIGALTRVAFNDSRSKESYGNSWIDFQRNSRLDFEARQGQTYYFLVNGENSDQDGTVRPEQTNTGRIQLNLTPLTPPPNDNFRHATPIETIPYRSTVSNYGATREPGEPRHAGIDGGRTVWWRWTADRNGPVVASTAGNLYDDYHARRTGLAVYTGHHRNALNPVASDQNGAGVNTGKDTWSLLTFTATAGTTYWFAADSQYPGNLAFILTTPPPNDDFDKAIEMKGSRWSTTGHNLGATTEPGEPRVDGGYTSVPENNFRSVWWKWTAPATGEIRLDTLGSQSLNVIAVFTGQQVNALTPVTPVPVSGGNPFNGNATERARQGNNRGPLFFNAAAGTTYFITVQGSGFVVPSAGPLVLSMEGPPAVPVAPAWVHAVRNGQRTIDLSWEDSAADEDSYLVQRSVDEGPWNLVFQSPPDTTGYKDTGVAAGTTASYRVKARNSVGDSPWTLADHITTLQKWRHDYFHTLDDSGTAANAAAPFGDLVPNLVKFAFNLRAAGYDRSGFQPGQNKGLPAVSRPHGPNAPLTVDFPRRRAETFPGIHYVVEFDDNPRFLSPEEGTDISVFPVDSTWEHVRVRDPASATAAPRYARVRIAVSP